ncbi:hypothetical protein DSO57_1024059 [Entomophthora muscae]|uniref:Uncharacterized protein n=1 Tax=Entomophthora muscae TaxID=34485 RepID=A0ACC2S4U2_9FUNG|nr:hypothetical protein DSO57_1024059 [Entomophthora muscae]
MPSSAASFLDTLRVLQLQNNQLKFIPLSLFSLIGLEELNLGNNEIIALPAEIGKLIFLRELYIHGNLISELPQQISLLENLQVLDVSYNRLMYFPVEIRQLNQLKTFWAGDNLFKANGSKVIHKNSFSDILSLFHMSLQAIGLKLDANPHFYCDSSCCSLTENIKSLSDSPDNSSFDENSRPKTPRQSSRFFNNLSYTPRNHSPYPKPLNLLRSISFVNPDPCSPTLDPEENPLLSVLPCLHHPMLKHILSSLPAPPWRPSCSLCHAYLFHPGLKITAVITGPTNQLIPVTYTACSATCRYHLIFAMDLAKAKSSRSLTL